MLTYREVLAGSRNLEAMKVDITEALDLYRRLLEDDGYAELKVPLDPQLSGGRNGMHVRIWGGGPSGRWLLRFTKNNWVDDEEFSRGQTLPRYLIQSVWGRLQEIYLVVLPQANHDEVVINRRAARAFDNV